MKREPFRYLWGFSLLIIASLACNILSGPAGRVSELQDTAEAAATSVQSGLDLLKTGQALATQFQGNEMVQTAMALATEQGPSFIQTVQAVATEQGPSIIGTAQALATEQGPSIIATSQALITQMSVSTAEVSNDIPLVPGTRENFVSAQDLVSYTTAEPYAGVVEFYKHQMPANGWIETNKSAWVETANATMLYYEKANRTAAITLSSNPLDGSTIVVVVIQSQ